MLSHLFNPLNARYILEKLNFAVKKISQTLKTITQGEEDNQINGNLILFNLSCATNPTFILLLSKFMDQERRYVISAPSCGVYSTLALKVLNKSFFFTIC